MGKMIAKLVCLLFGHQVERGVNPDFAFCWTCPRCHRLALGALGKANRRRWA